MGDEGDVSSSGPLQNETANIAVPKVLSVVADPLADEAESSPIITPRPADRTVAPLEQSEQDIAPPHHQVDVGAVLSNESDYSEHNQSDLAEHNQSAHLQQASAGHRHTNHSADVNLTGRLAVAHVHAVRQLKEALWPLVRANDSEDRCSALDGKNATDIAADEFLTSLAKDYAAGRCQLSGLFVIFAFITTGLTIAGVLTLLVDIRKRRARG